MGDVVRLTVDLQAWTLLPPEVSGAARTVRQKTNEYGTVEVVVEADLEAFAALLSWLNENVERLVPGRIGDSTPPHPLRWQLFDVREKIDRAVTRLTKAAAQAAREPGVLDETEKETLRKVLKGTTTGMTQRKIDNAAKTIGFSPAPTVGRFGQVVDPGVKMDDYGRPLGPNNRFRLAAARALGVELPEVQAEREAWETENGFRAPKVDPKQWDRRTCAACWGAYAMLPRGGGLTHHGYTRPGWGHIVGDCAGVRTEPWEVSPNVARATLRGQEDRAARLREIDEGRVKITKAPAPATKIEIFRTHDYFKTRIVANAAREAKTRGPIQIWWNTEQEVWGLMSAVDQPLRWDVFGVVPSDGKFLPGVKYDAAFLNDDVRDGKILVGPGDSRWEKALRNALDDVHRTLRYLWRPGFGSVPWLRAAIRLWKPSETGPVGAPNLNYPEDYAHSDFEGRSRIDGTFDWWITSEHADEVLGAEVDTARSTVTSHPAALHEILVPGE
jgi:hypothetical protein